jgi:uncharacterized protein
LAEDKEARLKAMVDHYFPGRWDILRRLTGKELKATTVLGMELSEVSAKIRSGPPGDDEEDYALPIWAGVIPFHTQVDAPVPCPRVLPEAVMPEHVKSYRYGG